MLDMGLFDQLIGGLLGGSTGAGSPVQNILMGLLTGQQGAQGNTNENSGGLAIPGGVAGLLSAFDQAGLGHIVQSWISNGANLPVSPEQLQSALGDERVQTMSDQAGMVPQDFLSLLSEHLPHAVNGVTPNGQLPDEGSVSV
jgi:uncharacterized protein YidB (DUF937 family)